MSINRRSIAFWVLTEGALQLALSCAEKIAPSALFVPDEFSQIKTARGVRGFTHFKPCLTANFHQFDAHLFIMASGIVVRVMAPLLRDKTTDPAVVVADEAGRHVISLISGHLGGANETAADIAEAIGAVPVLTTATDVNGILAVDTIARRIGAVVENKDRIKTVSTCMLRRLPVALVCDPALYQTCYGDAKIRPDHFKQPSMDRLAGYDAVCFITERTHVLPKDLQNKSLFIRPPNLVLGIGCNKHTPRREIADAVQAVFSDNRLSVLSIGAVASVDQKKDEPGLTAYARSKGHALQTFPAALLNSVDAPGMSPPSEHAQKHIGAKGVAEPAALQCAGPGATLVVAKRKIGNLTVAVAKKTLMVPLAGKGRLFVVGIGPGGDAFLTGHARRILESCEVVAGYKKYLEHIAHFIIDKKRISTGMTRETERVDAAIQAAVSGKSVALVCSGDAGIYGLAGLVYERVPQSGGDIGIEISPGVTAAAAAASLVGAPLTNDFITLSLSNLLTSTETVEKRIRVAASSDMVTAVYNPVSKKRTALIQQLRSEFLKHRKETTPVGVVTHALRGGQEVTINTLAHFLDCPMSMNSVIIIGNNDTDMINGKMVTRRGYERKENSV